MFNKIWRIFIEQLTCQLMFEIQKFCLLPKHSITVHNLCFVTLYQPSWRTTVYIFMLPLFAWFMEAIFKIKNIIVVSVWLGAGVGKQYIHTYSTNILPFYIHTYIQYIKLPCYTPPHTHISVKSNTTSIKYILHRFYSKLKLTLM